jgi:RNA-splicing ligase RtcB
MLANAMAMNYGFAFRLRAYSSLRELARASLGATDARLIVDSPHNTIYEEEVDGAPALVHRHNAARAFPASRMSGHPVFGAIGQALLVPGTNRTASYVCTAGEGAERSLYSACHGAGTTIRDMIERGSSAPSASGRVTWRYDYSGAGPTEVRQLDDRGIDEAVAILGASDIVRPVARLRPFAVLT